MKVALDWDGVLIDHPCNISFEEVLKYGPMKDAPRIVTYLESKGIELYVLTSRKTEQLPQIRKWLKKHGFPEMKVTNKKTSAVAYIDDRAIRFTNWIDISKYFA